MRFVRLILMFWLGLAPGHAAVAGDESGPRIVQAEVGKVLILDFPGNRHMAHRWRLVEEKSRGLNKVSVDPLGWIIAKEGSIFFSNNDTMRYRVIPRAPGEASLTFEHNYRGWNKKYHFTWKTVRLVISPAPGTQ